MTLQIALELSVYFLSVATLMYFFLKVYFFVIQELN